MLRRAAPHPKFAQAQAFVPHSPMSTGQEGFEHSLITSTEKVQVTAVRRVADTPVWRKYRQNVATHRHGISQRRAIRSCLECRRDASRVAIADGGPGVGLV